MYEIGEELKYHREKNGFSQSSLATATGISQQKISYYESGKHSIPIEFCITLADFYGIRWTNLSAEILYKIKNKRHGLNRAFFRDVFKNVKKDTP